MHLGPLSRKSIIGSQGVASPFWAIVSFPMIEEGPARKGHRDLGSSRGDGEWRTEWIWGTESDW